MALIISDIESCWPLGSQLVEDGLRLLTWEIIKGHTNAWTVEEKAEVIRTIEKYIALVIPCTRKMWE